MKNLFCLLAIILATGVYAQENKLKFSGYLESYYGYDFNKPGHNERPSFVYSHNRHNEVNLNLGFIKASYDDGMLRTSLALMAGTYSNANLSAEPGVLKNIFEANAGIRLNPAGSLWLDAGILPSHIGFESAVSKDCWALTRNISSDNTPYYESGVRLSYNSAGGRFSAAALYLNGWQRISRQDGNSSPAGGLLLSWKPLKALSLNYSNYLGSEGPDSIRTTRFYNNFYSIVQLCRGLGITLGLDYGIQQENKGLNKYKHIIAPVMLMRYQLQSQWTLTGRLEYYQDAESMMISLPGKTGFRASAYSLNIDYAPVANAVIRAEGKLYHSRNGDFLREEKPVKYNALITTSIAISF